METGENDREYIRKYRERIVNGRKQEIMHGDPTVDSGRIKMGTKWRENRYQSYFIIFDRRKIMKLKEKYLISPAGNRTPVSRVTGGDTHHYTTEELMN